MKTSCTKIKAYIYLCGEGELSDSQVFELKAHITECQSCKKELESVNRFRALTSAAASYIPEHDLSESDLGNIMSVIRREKSRPSGNAIDKFLELFYRPSVRFSIVFLILILVCTFLYQSTVTFTDITQLEKRMQSGSRVQSTSASIVELDELSHNLKDFYLFLKGDNTYLNLSSNLIVVDRDLFRSLFRVHNKLMNMYNSNPREFSNNYPELTRYLLEEMDPEELDSMLVNNDLVKDLNSILTEGK